ncbi:hypothetical protein [Actinoplanes utahensis]|uniref:Uncharacterized protein n=1 Tax=Actinoplanes utahensis TaxID=1869 RepID=A0A0A6XD70_ACTUT|nr:hypothetical protein [Actinoplanes utahensis]KHD78047.1 hypothetical protein MB27_08110 [Actinoplanes utahensis]GIF30061.1 hypothetical protein Aut01nite_30470 [Actinoplanes utahensis]
MNFSVASPSAWNAHAAYSRLSSARAKLATDQMPTAAAPGVITADRAAVANAEAEVARVVAAHAAEVARFQRSGQFLDVYA